jgi:glutathione S-transferase
MMKLYFSPGACSLAPHILLTAVGAGYETNRIDMKTKTTANGEDFAQINPKSQVPVLITKEGKTLTENAVILGYIADQFPEKNLMPKQGTWERYQANEWLNFVATELHKGLGFLFHADRVLPEKTANEELKKNYKESLGRKFEVLSQHLKTQPFMLGQNFSAVDAYAFTILNWHGMLKIDLTKWPVLMGYMEKVKALPAVHSAMKAEGLL